MIYYRGYRYFFMNFNKIVSFYGQYRSRSDHLQSRIYPNIHDPREKDMYRIISGV